jgi:hypothetical protein
MCTGRDWEERDRRAARTFVRAAHGVGRVVDLGGLQPPPGQPTASAHLRSRGEGGRILRDGEVLTRWSGALAGGSTYTFEDREGIAVEVRTRWVEAPQEAVYRAFASLGGGRGWRVWRWAWRIRGLIDQLLGGPGLRRGRRHPVDLQPGEAVDFWRVEDARPPELLLLRAEMKVPGKAWLQWEAVPEGNGTRLIQRAFFSPTGFWGAAYW